MAQTPALSNEPVTRLRHRPFGSLDSRCALSRSFGAGLQDTALGEIASDLVQGIIAVDMNPIIQLGDKQVDGPSLAEVCRRYGVKELSLFGSAAPGDMRPESDINVMVEFEPDARGHNQVWAITNLTNHVCSARF